MRAIVLSDREKSVERVLLDQIMKKKHGYDSKLVTDEHQVYDIFEAEQFDVAVIHGSTIHGWYWEKIAVRMRAKIPTIPIYAIHGIRDEDMPCYPDLLAERNIQFSSYWQIDKFEQWLEENKK